MLIVLVLTVLLFIGGIFIIYKLTGLATGPDGTNIDFISPTPANNYKTNQQTFTVSMSSSDTLPSANGEHSTFLDYDRSLYAWYRFSTLSDFVDHSTYTNDGVNTGTTYNTGINPLPPRKRGGGRIFDGIAGSTKYVTIGNQNGEYETVCRDGCTFSAFIYPFSATEQTTIGTIIGRSDNTGGNEFFLLGTDSSSNIYFFISSNGLARSCKMTTSGRLLTIDAWHHVVATYNPSNSQITIYHNGNQIGSPVTCPFTSIVTTGMNSWDNYGNNEEDTLIGVHDDSSLRNEFNGVIDEVMVFSRALSLNEIKSLYDAKTTQYSRTFSNVPNGVHTYIGYTIDSNGNFASETQRSITIDTNYVSPVCGNGFVESGEVCDGNSRSCSVNGYAGTQTCKTDCSGYNTCNTNLFCGDNIKNGNEICDGTDLGGKTCLDFGYISGTLSCAADCSAHVIGLCTSPTPSSNLVAHIKGDDDTLTDLTATDSSTYTNNGACVSSNCPAYTSTGGILNSGVYTYSNDILTLPTSTSLHFGTGSFSFSGWINPSSASDFRIINNRGRGDVTNEGWQIKINSDPLNPGKWGFYDTFVSDGGQSLGCFSSLCGDSADRWNYNELKHVVVTFSNSYPTGTDTLTIYVNGVNVYSVSSSNIENINTATVPTEIGGTKYTNGAVSTIGQTFAGKIDDVRLYNKVLSSSEVTTLYNEGLSAPPTSVCGNGIIETGEECETNPLNLVGQTCLTKGFSGGTLNCYASGTVNQCKFDTSLCTSTYVECNDGIDNDIDTKIDMLDSGCSSTSDNDETNCGDTKCEGGETSTSCPTDCPVTSVCGNSICESGETATSCAVDCAPVVGACGNAIVNIGELCDDGRGNGVCPSTCSSSCTFNSCSKAGNIHYVTPLGSGTKSGNDWNNAMAKSVLLSAQRGHTYYLADGNYLAQDIYQAASGTSYIYVLKATGNNPVVNSKAGWTSTLTDGVADFDQVRFRDSNIVFDGAIGGGPGSWKSGHGFYVDGTDGSDPINIPSGFSPSSIRISHTEVEGDLSVNAGSNDLIYINVPSPVNNWKFTFNHLHDTGRTWMIWRNVNNAIVEYSYFARGDSSAAQHGNGISSHMGSDNILRYNMFEDGTGTSVLTWGGQETTDPAYYHTTPDVCMPTPPSTTTSCFDPRGPYGDRWQIYGNIFFDVALPAGRGQGVLSDWSERITNDNKIYNNDFYALTGEQNDISFSNTHVTVNSKVYNNIFYGIDNSGSSATTFFKTTRDSNTFESGTTKFNPTPLQTNEQTISTNPFVNPSPTALNFSLSNPNLINPGKQEAWMDNKDMYGNVRGADGKWDRGAIEYKAA